MILECAKLDREINYFVDIVQQVTAEVSTTWHGLISSAEGTFSPWAGQPGLHKDE